MTLPAIDIGAVNQVLESSAAVEPFAGAPEPIHGEPSVHLMLATLEATGFTAPFDWQGEFGERLQDLENVEVLQGADLEQLRKIMTAHTRIDRFSDGHLDHLIRTGYWNRCIERLRMLRDEM